METPSANGDGDDPRTQHARIRAGKAPGASPKPLSPLVRILLIERSIQMQTQARCLSGLGKESPRDPAPGMLSLPGMFVRSTTRCKRVNATFSQAAGVRAGKGEGREQQQ